MEEVSLPRPDLFRVVLGLGGLRLFPRPPARLIVDLEIPSPLRPRSR